MQTNNTNHPAKFAFFYMLGLVALVITALSTGMIIFQIINKTIADVLENYAGATGHTTEHCPHDTQATSLR